MAELERIKTRLLGNYNSLTDEHLAEYFSNPRIRRHLISAGLIRQTGELVSAEDYKARLLEEKRWLASQAFLAQAIVRRALDLEFSRRAHLQRQLEEIIRMELVERVRSARRRHVQSAQPTRSVHYPSGSHRAHSSHKKHRAVSSVSHKAGRLRKKSARKDTFAKENDGDIFTICHSESSTEIENHSSSDFELQTNTRPTGSANSRLLETAASPYSVSVVTRRAVSRTRSASYCMKGRTNLGRKGILIPSQPQILGLFKNGQYSCSEVTMKFLGTRSFISSSVNGGRQDVLVKQQFSGGNLITPFNQPLSPGSIFSFYSRRYIEFPFSVTIYVDGIVVLRLSACCEYKYHVGYRLGGPQGYFILTSVRGTKFCHKCGPERRTNSFLPPVSNYMKSMPSKESPFSKSTTQRRLAWSHSNSYSEKQVALITPSEKPIQPSADRRSDMSNGNPNAPWVLTVALNSWDNSDIVKNSLENVDSLLDSLAKTDILQTARSQTNRREENLEEEISEEIISEAIATSALMTADDDSVVEIDEQIQIKEKFDQTAGEESGTVDSDESSTEESYSESSEGSGSSASSNRERLATGGPEITVSRATGEESHTASSSSGSTGSSGSESESYSESETDDDENGKPATSNLLKPDDAHRSRTKQPESSGEIQSDDVDKVTSKKKRNAQLKVNEVPFDSSDDEEGRKFEVTTVTADVHFEPVKNLIERTIPKLEKIAAMSSEERRSPSSDVSRQDSLAAESTNGRRSSIYKMIAHSQRNSSEEGERGQNGSDSQTSSVQDNGSEVELIGYDLDESQIHELCDEIRHRPELLTLTIKKGGIDDFNIVPIIDALVASNCSLKSLNLNLNQLGPQAGQKIAQLIRAKPTLNALFLRGNPLHDSGLGPIVDALLKNISDNINESQDAECGVGLHQLDVGDCNFRNEGATNLASLIEQSRSLNTLILTSNNQLHDDDWSSIFWAVGQNAAITTLFVDYCCLGDDGVACLLSEVQDHPSLEAVDLEGNQITDEGGRILLNWARNNPVLHQLRIETGNNIKETIVQDINKALDRKK